MDSGGEMVHLWTGTLKPRAAMVRYKYFEVAYCPGSRNREESFTIVECATEIPSTRIEPTSQVTIQDPKRHTRLAIHTFIPFKTPPSARYALPRPLGANWWLVVARCGEKRFKPYSSCHGRLFALALNQDVINT